MESDAATVSLNSGEIGEAPNTSLLPCCTGVKTTVTAGKFDLISGKNVDAASNAGASKEVRLSGSVLISSIIVVSVHGDVSVPVSSKKYNPIVS